MPVSWCPEPPARRGEAAALTPPQELGSLSPSWPQELPAFAGRAAPSMWQLLLWGWGQEDSAQKAGLALLCPQGLWLARQLALGQARSRRSWQAPAGCGPGLPSRLQGPLKLRGCNHLVSSWHPWGAQGSAGCSSQGNVPSPGAGISTMAGSLHSPPCLAHRGPSFAVLP